MTLYIIKELNLTERRDAIMAFGPVGKIRRQVMSSMKKSSSYGVNTFKPYSYKPKKSTYSSTMPKIKWK